MIRSLKIGFAAGIFLVCLNAFADSPVSMLEGVANQVVSELQKNKSQLKDNPNISYSIIKKYLIPKVDVYGMSRSVLGRDAWKKATLAQKKNFARGFVKLVIRTYASALSDYSDEKVTFYPLRGGYEGKRFLRVNSAITRSSGKPIPLSYSLVHKKAGWRVYDMTVEGVSLLQSFKSQFRAELARGDIDDLIEKLKR
jgi:phospholipid transport system substrate-binding protein